MSCFAWGLGMYRLAVIAAVLPSVIGFPGAACAADLPPSAYTKAPGTVADIYNWTGIYVGFEGGGDWGRSQHYQNDPAASAANVNQDPGFHGGGAGNLDGGGAGGFRGGGFGGGRGGLVAGPPLLGLAETGGIDPSGVLLGGTIGYNYQFSNNIVVGIENDISSTNTKGSANLIPPFVTAQMFQTSQTWLDTLRGRIGYAWNRLLVYGTGGAAFTNEGILLCDPIAAGCGSQSRTVTGWTAGAEPNTLFEIIGPSSSNIFTPISGHNSIREP
jgi:outer membrane immunogenic protein